MFKAPDLLGESRFQLFQSDAIEWLRTIPNASIDCVITDPAYESLEKHRARGTTPRLVDWFPIFRNDRYHDLFTEFYRILKNNTHCYIYCDQETMFVIKPIAEACGFRFWKAIIWDKVSIGMGYHYRSQYEMILFFEKGKRKLNNRSDADIIRCKRILKGYPTEKPPAVSEVLIKQSTNPGEIVLDCFMGSASTGTAAIECDRKFLGCDISSRSIELATDRFAQTALSFN